MMLDKNTWNDLVSNVRMQWVCMKSLSASQNLSFPMISEQFPDPMAIDVRAMFKLKPEKHIRVNLDFLFATPELKATYTLNRKKIIEIKAKYAVTYAVETGAVTDTPDELWVAFLQKTLPLVLGPMFRELTQNIAGRMQIVLPPLPLFKVKVS